MTEQPYSYELSELIKATFRIVDDINLVERKITKPVDIYDTLLGEERFFLSFIVSLKDIVHNTIPNFELKAQAENDPSIRSYCPNTIDSVLENFNEQGDEQNQKGQSARTAFQLINKGLEEKEKAEITRPYAPSLPNPGYEKILEGITALMQIGQFDLDITKSVADYHILSNPRVIYNVVKKLNKEMKKAAKNNVIIRNRLEEGNYDYILKSVKNGVLKPGNNNQEYRLDPETLAQVIYSQEKHTTYHKERAPTKTFPEVEGDAQRDQKTLKYYFKNIFGGVEASQEKMADASGLPLKFVKKVYTPVNPVIC